MTDKIGVALHELDDHNGALAAYQGACRLNPGSRIANAYPATDEPGFVSALSAACTTPPTLCLATSESQWLNEIANASPLDRSRQCLGDPQAHLLSRQVRDRLLALSRANFRDLD